MRNLDFSFTTSYHKQGKHDGHKSHHPVGIDKFIAVDGEGVTIPGGDHPYVLLGVGQEQIENPAGLAWPEIFDFLYERWAPRTAFVGFYLGYDFTQWLKTFPEERARKLLTIDGRESRRSKSPAMHGKFLPVDLDDWQVDMLGSKQFSFRRKECDCPMVKCGHKNGPWLYVCDAGPFFQTSFLNVINPENWQHPIVTDDEYATIVAGKEHRASAALDNDMRRYNLLENDVLERVLTDLNTGFTKLEVALSARQWYGPGQAAQSWMRGRAPTSTEISETVPSWFLDAARQSYFGGWFELMAHGIIPGTCYENDINNAYPYIISRLPCLLHGSYRQGGGTPPVLAEGEICLVRALVWTAAPHSYNGATQSVGAMPHRDTQGRICRPIVTAGWYWYDELESAITAKLVVRPKPEQWFEWMTYTPCDCLPPLRQVKHLYQMRLDVGKKTSLGKAAKLVNNSIYGKTAQSVGAPRFANPVYASRITSGCRRMITDAIATHPGGKSNVVMVATDAVYFLDPHPLLPYGTGLGEWETKPKHRLTLFKPGVYWDDHSRDEIAAGDHPSFKARGVSAHDFSKVIGELDAQFDAWGDSPPSIDSEDWPTVSFESSFAMVTALQALVRNDWPSAGHVDQAKALIQSANPGDKRTKIYVDIHDGRRIYRSSPLVAGRNAVYRHSGNVAEWSGIAMEQYDSVPYEKRFGLEDPFSDENTQAFGVSPDEHQPFRGMFRVLTGQE